MAGTLDHNTLQLDKATNDLKALLEDVIKTKQAGTKQSYLQSLSNNGISLLLEIKHLSDFSQEEESQSNRIDEYKQKLSPLDSQLESLRYEKECYIAEIEKCRQYGFDDITQILSGEQDAMSDSQERRPAPATGSSFIDEIHHRQMLDTLNNKLLEKIRLAKEVEDLNQKKIQLKETVATTTKKLNSLDAKLKAIAKNSTMFQQYIPLLTPNQTNNNSNNKISPATAGALPPSLFLIYRQAVNYADFFDNDIEVVINGDVPNENTLPSNPSTPHSLSVTIKFPSLGYFTVKFLYYPVLSIITAYTPANANVLLDLFPNLNNVSFPSLSYGQGESILEEIEGKPFQWAQELGRVDHLLSSSLSSPSSSSFDLSVGGDNNINNNNTPVSFQNFIKRIKTRLGS